VLHEFWGWYFPALQAAKEVLESRPIAAILSTSPPGVAHVIAKRLKRISGVPWIADFRDPWAENDLLRGYSARLRRIHDQLEAGTICQADTVICNTEHLRLRFQERYPQLPTTKFVTVTNGFDEAADMVKIAPRSSPERRIAHLGSLDEQRRVDTFCEAVALLIARGQIQPTSFRVQFVGDSSKTVLEAAYRATPELIRSGQVQFLPQVNWQRAQEIMWDADLLLLFQGGHRVQIPAKFYEYLRSGKPMLAVADPGALTDLLTATGGGLGANISDPKDIAEKLLMALQLPPHSPEEVQTRWGNQFHYRMLAGQLAAQIHRLAEAPSRAPSPSKDRPALAQPAASAGRTAGSRLDYQRRRPLRRPLEVNDHFIILHHYPDSLLESSWQDCLTRVEYASHYTSPAFFLEPLWAGKRPFAVLALDSQRVVGVLTGIHEGSETLSGLSSRPQVCIDRTADQAAVISALIRGFLREAESSKLITAYTWSWTPLDAFLDFQFRSRPVDGCVVLDLTRGPAALFREFSHGRRSNIRFAIKRGVNVFQATNSDDLLAWYEVFSAWRVSARKNMQPPDQSFATFERLFALTDNRRVFLAQYEGKVVAAVEFRFYPGGLIESSTSCSLEESLNLKANDLLQWRGMEWACSQGFLRHSLGACHTFLRRFGGTVVPIIRYSLDRTWLRRHDLQEAVVEKGRDTLRQMPPPLQITIRRMFGKAQPRRDSESAIR
jgi:glycosyltransferase involved in cell wall biosynthesis